MTSAPGTTAHTASRHCARRARSSALPPPHSAKDRISRISLDVPWQGALDKSPGHGQLSRRHALIMVMQPPGFGDRDHLPAGRRLDRPRLWTVHGERLMGSPVMVIGQVASQEALQMPLMEDYRMIQTLSPDTADESLDIRILPRRAGGRHHFMDAHMAHTLPKIGAVDAVPIAQEIAWRLVPRERLDQLLGRPLGGWMLSDAAVYNASTLMRQDHEDEEHPECHCRDHKKIQGDQV